MWRSDAGHPCKAKWIAWKFRTAHWTFSAQEGGSLSCRRDPDALMGARTILYALDAAVFYRNIDAVIRAV